MLAAMSVLASCQKKEVMIDPDAAAPVIGEIQIAGAPLVYDGKIDYTVDINDQSVLSHATVKLTIGNDVVYETTVPAENNTTLTVSGSVSVPFGPMCMDTNGKLTVTTMNKNLKTSEATAEVKVVRPSFSHLYVQPKEGTFADAIELVKVPEDEYLYRVEGLDFDNGSQFYIVSGEGEGAYKWGFDEATAAGSIGNVTAIPFCDSESTSDKVTWLSFDLLSFEVLPLKKEMSINGTTFNKFKMTPEDSKFVDNTFLASNISLQKDKAAAIELIDLEQILFDPDYFKVEDGKIIFIAEDMSANLYLNKLHNFVYVEPVDKPWINASASFPDRMLLNGYGVGVPELWFYNPGWNFGKALTLYKTGTDGDQNVYTLTACFSDGASFKFFNAAAWGGDAEVKPLAINYLDDTFYAKEEPKKPGNYNIAMKDGSAKSSVIKITVKTKDGKTVSLSSKVIRTSENDK